MPDAGMGRGKQISVGAMDHADMMHPICERRRCLVCFDVLLLSTLPLFPVFCELIMIDTSQGVWLTTGCIHCVMDVKFHCVG